MNECLTVYLKLDMEKSAENEELIERIDELLLTVGMKYSGVMNMYIPVDRQNRDQAVFRAEELLMNTDWLRDILAYKEIGQMTNACPMEMIQTDMMSHPSQEKLWYYEQYYQKKHKLPHAVVVDENKQLRDGYISYLLAKKYNVSVDVCEMVSGQPLRKIVIGTHVKFTKGNWRKKDKKRYVWIYALKEPVIPGDILLVKTTRGTDFICVDSINYAAGKEFCSKYKKVEKHLHVHMEEGDTNYGK